MKRSLQDYASIAEIISGIAVVISLLYVGFQIQIATNESRSQSAQSIFEGQRELHIVQIENVELGDAWFKVLGGEELTKREEEILQSFLVAHLMLLEETYEKYKQGYLHDNN